MQTEVIYRGSAEQLRAVMEAVETALHKESYKAAELHIISWSANSGAEARQAGTLGSFLQTASFIPGYGVGRSIEQICRHKNLRINFITGSKDRSWLRGAEKMRDQLKACGMEHVTFVVIDGGGHVLKRLAVNPCLRY